MKALLVKREDRYDLYKLSDRSKIASTAPNPFGKLSMRNCESIEKGYSIEEIDALFKKVPHTVQNEEDYWKCRAGFITGFQTAMEILGDKKFTEEDVKKAITDFYLNDKLLTEKNLNSSIQSLQQTEWEVDITEDTDLMWEFPEPKLDPDGCLILKRIQ